MSNRVTDFFALHPAYEDAINHVEGQHSPSIYYPMANIGSAVLSGRWLETETKLLEDVAHFPEIPVLGEHDLTPSFHLLDRSNANGNDFPLNRNSPYQSNHVPPSPMSPDLQLFTFDDILIACDGVDDGSYEPYSLSFGSQGSSAEPSTAVEECISSPNMNEMLSPPALPWLKLTPDDVEASPILAQPTAQGFEYENVMSPVSPGKRTSDSLRIECPFTMCCSKSFVRTCDLHRHIALLHLVPQPLYECTNCNARFSRHESRDRHAQRNACGKRVKSQRRTLPYKALKDVESLRNSDHPAIVEAREYLARLSPR